jgi:hypothetical protein
MPDQMNSFLYLRPECKKPVLAMVLGVHLFTVELRKQDQSQGLIHVAWRVRENITEPNNQPSLVEPCCMTKPREGEKIDDDLRDGSSRL